MQLFNTCRKRHLRGSQKLTFSLSPSSKAGDEQDKWSVEQQQPPAVLSGCWGTCGVFFLQGFPLAQGSLTPQHWLQLFPHYICQLHSTGPALLCATHNTFSIGRKNKAGERQRGAQTNAHRRKEKATAETHNSIHTQNLHIFVLINFCVPLIVYIHSFPLT